MNAQIAKTAARTLNVVPRRTFVRTSMPVSGGHHDHRVFEPPFTGGIPSMCCIQFPRAIRHFINRMSSAAIFGLVVVGGCSVIGIAYKLQMGKWTPPSDE